MTGTSKAKLIVGIVIGVLGIIIVLQNFHTVISMLGYLGSPKERKTE